MTLPRLLFLVSVPLLALGACVTTPVENYARSVDFEWSLSPDLTAKDNLQASQGDLIMTWSASAYPQYEISATG